MTPGLDVEQLAKNYQGRPVLQDVSFCLSPGHWLIIMGPTGCGKSTLLRLLAGLEPYDAGQLSWDGQSWKKIPAYQRPVAMVMQHHPLLSHLSVWKNITFGQQWWADARLSRSQQEAKIRDLVAPLEMDELLDRSPSALSGGQIQQVALAQALARQPQLLLLDEPLAHLDPHRREFWRQKLENPVAQKSPAVIWVTHDGDEALALVSAANRQLAVLEHGRILQQGHAQTLYENPVSSTVAQLLGRPPINLVHVDVFQEQDQWKIRPPSQPRDQAFEIPASLGKRMTQSTSPSPTTLGIRPHQLSLTPMPGGWEIPGVVCRLQTVGPNKYAMVQTNLGTLTIAPCDFHTSPVRDAMQGQSITMFCDPETVLVFQE